ncbi:hypothetical protein J4G33_01655 [Actinotalea sp. BY-33]|uniref:Uncharacterized protein n=1 Tax=Actinotalea soli TaxID=2819234 RepID=A0A939LMP8_9CELL|nr:hypothetical protein [Actinotalea soli]MBO1750501.1 hypothetical protein [Actinotalea soli]
MTQYDPRDRDTEGVYHGALDSVSDRGPVERAYLEAARSFMEECGVTELTVRDPESHLEADPDREPLAAAHPLARILGTGLERWVDGAALSAADAIEVVRWMHRGDVWCRLEHFSGFAIHVGYDLYMYIVASKPCPKSVEAASALGVFPEPMSSSPYERDLDDMDHSARVVDASFWADVDALAAARGAVAIIEHAAWPRRWTMTAGGTHPTTRAGSYVAVWPQWPERLTGLTLAAIPRVVYRLTGRSSYRWGVHADVQVADGLVWRGRPAPPDLYDEMPALRGVTPEPNGTVTARWHAWFVEP